MRLVRLVLSPEVYVHSEDKPVPDEDELTLFHSVVAGCTDGGLTFPPPFDVVASGALADNADSGQTAEELFRYTVQRNTAYTVRIFAETPENPEVGTREVIDTHVSSTRTLIGLLETLTSELRRRLTEQEQS